MLRKAASILVLCSLGTAACGGDDGPSAPGVPGLSEVIELDMHMPDGGTASVTGPVLEAGKSYRVIIAGTYSIWGESMWDGDHCKGAPEAAPVFPSPGSDNGWVGIDPEFYFGIPSGSALCSEDIPRGSGGVEANFDGGNDWDDLDPVTPTDLPRADHTYEYRVEGQGHALRFRREDSPSSDNYGVLRITIEEL
jgi:hypothetical protein